MKQIFLILISFFILASCNKDENLSPEEDIREFISENPYSVVFENSTDGDLYMKCEGLYSTSFPILKQGEESETFRGPQPDITVEYTGEGTHFTTIKKQVTLSKEKVTKVSLTYP